MPPKGKGGKGAKAGAGASGSGDTDKKEKAQKGGTAVKSLKTLKQTAEGLHQVLNMQPSAKTVEVYREVFGSSNGEGCPVLCNKAPVRRQTIRRAASETEYSMDYIPLAKIPATSAEH